MKRLKIILLLAIAMLGNDWSETKDGLTGKKDETQTKVKYGTNELRLITAPDSLAIIPIDPLKSPMR